jgi:superfamily II DNA or RNA helicase
MDLQDLINQHNALHNTYISDTQTANILINKIDRIIRLNKLVIRTFDKQFIIKSLKHCKTFDDVYGITKNMTNKEKGNLFEVITFYCFKLCPQLNNGLEELYMYSDIPLCIMKKLNLPTQDRGIDLIARIDGEYHAIQSKFRQNTDEVISWKELSTFYGLSFGINDQILGGYLVTNTYDMCPEVIRSKKVDIISGNFFEDLPDNFFSDICNDLKGKQINGYKALSPMPHQEQCIDKTVEYFKTPIPEDTDNSEDSDTEDSDDFNDSDNDLDNMNSTESNDMDSDSESKQLTTLIPTRGYIEMACGTGKSLTSYWIDKKMDTQKTVVFVPSLYLLSQIYADWVKQSYAENIHITYILIGSDADFAEDITYSLPNGLMLSTDPVQIKKKVKKTKGKIVIISTYQSADKLADACNKISFDLGIFDEAHKTVGQAGKQFSAMITDDNLKINKRIFMTATPKNYIGESDDMISMDNTKFYGHQIYAYNTGNAINDQRLTDYQMLTIVATDQEIEHSIQKNKLIKYKDVFEDTEANYLGTILILLSKIHDNTSNHLITYYNKTKSAHKFKEMMIQINDELYPGKPIFIDSLDGSTQMSRRTQMIKEYVKAEKGILCSARVLNEGVNIPIVDSVCFVDPRQSTIDIVQCIGRALRKYKGKEMAHVFVPTFIKDFNIVEELDKNIYGKIIGVLKAMKSTDEGVTEYFVSKDNGKVGKRNICKVERFVEMNQSIEIDLNEWDDQIGAKIWKILDPWLSRLEEIKQWIDKNKKRPVSTSKNNIEYIYARWLNRQTQHYKKRLYALSNISYCNKWNEFIEKYIDYMMDDNTKWYATLNNVDNWIHNNKKRPSANSKIEVESKYARWISNQCTSYNNLSGIMRDIDKKNKWELFVQENKNYIMDLDTRWDDTLDKVKIYIDENKIRPSNGSKDKYIKFLGGWISTQIKNKSCFMQNENRRTKWNDFLRNYEDYIVDIDLKWNDMLNQSKIYIDKNRKKPSVVSKNKEEKRIGMWLKQQSRNYNSNTNAMKDNDKKIKWEIFIKKYEKYMINIDTKWYSKLNELKIWINTNNKRPSHHSTDNTEKILGGWIGTQYKSYKKNTHSMNDQDRRVKWEEFLKEYSKYFNQTTDNDTKSNKTSVIKIRKYMSDSESDKSEVVDKKKMVKVVKKSDEKVVKKVIVKKDESDSESDGYEIETK